MIAAFTNITFLNPWILAGAAALPLLWLLLRVMPPAPKRILIPTARFLEGLIPERRTPSRTPWWILLLRILIALLILLALAHPVYNPAKPLAGSGPVRLVIDNGWAAAQNWQNQIKEAENISARADRQNRPIYILTLAPEPGQSTPIYKGPLPAHDAQEIIGGLLPLPWAADYTEAKRLIEEKISDKNISSFWISHGLDEGPKKQMKALIKTLQEQGSLSYFEPPPERLPLTLRPSTSQNKIPQVSVIAPENIPAGLPVTLQALDARGHILDQQNVALQGNTIHQDVSLNIPPALHNDIAELRLVGRQGAGAVFITDGQFRKRHVGIASPAGEEESTPFIEANYYLHRALEPSTELEFGDIDNLLAHNVSALILPDVEAMPPETLQALDEWVNKGGLLLRFAGPKMAQHLETNLVPVTLRAGGRALEGALTWEKPLHFASFPETSPLYGIKISNEVIVKRQILAEPSNDLKDKTWATLSDGTPIITAAPQGEGMIVLIHTTASPDWSDLPLSGSYVEILKRIINMAGQKKINSDIRYNSLAPLWTLDGWGQRETPPSTVTPLATEETENTTPSSLHPPGLYAHGSVQYALNIGSAISILKTPGSMPPEIQRRHYGEETYEADLMPLLLATAFMLLLADSVIMLFLSGSIRFFRLVCLILTFAFMPQHVFAQEPKNDTYKYADGLYLAYMRSGDTTIDTTAQAGLENLAQTLRQRTSADVQGVVGLNPGTDELAFFPLIYWPIYPYQEPLSSEAIDRIQHYLDYGGTILFDTREYESDGMRFNTSPAAQKLRQITSSLDIPPLAPIEKNHVLTRSFYLIDHFPGRFSGATVWVEKRSASGRDNVSSVIIGSHDWAGAWALTPGQSTSLAEGARQQEMSIRFGVNVVMYALTGNYKADQVHVPYILERLGQ